MRYKKLGRTGLKVSVLCLGAMVFGDQVSEADGINLIKSTLDTGINFLDTANIYAESRSEEIIGKALKGIRHSVVIATKVEGRTGPGANDVGLSRKHIKREIENSLKRLQTDYIDLYYAHWPDYDTPLEETLRAFDDLIHEGKVRYIGCSNYSAWMLCKSLWLSDVHNLARFDAIEPPYNLLTRDIETELLPLCSSEGVGVCVYNPLAGELLSGIHEYGKPPVEGRFTHHFLGQMYLDRYWSQINFEAITRIRQIAKEHRRTLPQFALAWVLNNEAITSAISGTTTLEQLKENVAATEIKLSDEELKACDDVWKVFRPPRYSYFKTVEETSAQ